MAVRIIGGFTVTVHRPGGGMCLAPASDAGADSLWSALTLLLLEDRFPRILVPSWDNRDLRQLLWHRHRMVQMRTRIMNQLQAVALNERLRCKKRLWQGSGRKQLETFPLAPWASRRRRDFVGVTGSTEPNDRGADARDRTGSGEISRGAATDDPSRSRCPDGAGLRAGHRKG